MKHNLNIKEDDLNIKTNDYNDSNYAGKDKNKDSNLSKGKITDISYINDNKNLEEFLNSYGKKIYFIGFFDGKENNSSKKLFNKSYDIYEDIKNKNNEKPLNFGWINATCQERFSSIFNINEYSLPNLIAFIPSKSVYAILSGNFETENLQNFIEKLIRGQINLYQYDKKLITLDKINCEEIIENKEFLIEGEDLIIKEVLEEDRIKREYINNDNEINENKNEKGEL